MNALMEMEGLRHSLREEGLRLGGDGVVLDISEAKDFRLMKTVVKEGDGARPPCDGSHMMKLHYTGRLLPIQGGEVFDSSLRRGGPATGGDATRLRLLEPDPHERNGSPPFQFALGAGTVIHGWDVGVASMTRGEHALLLCAPEYAYGDRATGSIAAGSTLLFEVELFDWVERWENRPFLAMPFYRKSRTFPRQAQRGKVDPKKGLCFCRNKLLEHLPAVICYAGMIFAALACLRMLHVI
jgi:hypothetical protein